MPCVWLQVNLLAGRHEFLLQTVKRRKLSRFAQICRRHHTLPKIILQGTVYGRLRRGRPRKSLKDKIKKWTGQLMPSLLRIAEYRRRWKATMAQTSVGVAKRRLGVTGISYARESQAVGLSETHRSASVTAADLVTAESSTVQLTKLTNTRDAQASLVVRRQIYPLYDDCPSTSVIRDAQQ